MTIIKNSIMIIIIEKSYRTLNNTEPYYKKIIIRKSLDKKPKKLLPYFSRSTLVVPWFYFKDCSLFSAIIIIYVKSYWFQ